MKTELISAEQAWENEKKAGEEAGIEFPESHRNFYLGAYRLGQRNALEAAADLVENMGIIPPAGCIPVIVELKKRQFKAIAQEIRSLIPQEE